MSFKTRTFTGLDGLIEEITNNVLARVNEKLQNVTFPTEALDAHVADNVRHITDSERAKWNAKDTSSDIESDIVAHNSDRNAHPALVNALTSQLDRKYALKSDVSAVFRYKGSKASYAEVTAITNPSVGDVYVVGSAEYVCTNVTGGVVWTELGAPAVDADVDLSDYLTRTDADSRYAASSHNHDSRYALKSNVEYIDWSQAIIIRSQHTAAIYSTKWESTAAYDVKIKGSTVCSIGAVATNSDGYECVAASSSQYTRYITIKKRGMLMVADSSNGIGFCKRGTSSWTPIPLGAESKLASISMDVLVNDKIIVRCGNSTASENDPATIVYAPFVIA